MRTLIKALIILAIVMVLVPRIVYANNSIDTYYYEQIDEKIILCYETFIFGDNICIEDKILIALYKNLTNKEHLCFFPDNTRILNIDYSLGYLSINFSREILNLGGNDNEAHLLEMIKRTVFSLKEVKYLTILVEGELIPLSEGSFIFEEDFIEN